MNACRHTLDSGKPECRCGAKLWHNKPRRAVSVITASGTKASGEIKEWTGPAECYVSPDGSANRTRGVLIETARRRKTVAS